ncbi:MAG: ABC transporter substrate-binding protein [Alphaproteobacteria bacterium]
MERQKIKATYVFRFCEQNKKKCHGFVNEIKEAKPDLIFTWGTSACEAIAGTIDAPNKQEYIWDIPIISLIVTDPIKSKVIFDLKKTGRNVTGVNHVAPVTSHIEAMKSYLKDLKKVAALYNPTETNSKIMIEELKSIGPEYGLEITDHPIPLNDKHAPMSEKIAEEIDKIAEENSQFIYLPADTFLLTNIGTVMDAANKHKLLTMGTTELAFVSDNRPLMGFLSHYYDVGLFGGFKAEQILIYGKNPNEIPYEKLKNFSLILSPEVFRKIKIHPPLSILKYSEILPELDSNVKKDADNGNR